MNPLIIKHKRLAMIVGIGTACVLLAGARWFMSYAPSNASKNKNSEGTKGESGNTPAVRSFRCKRVTFIDNLVMTGTLQGGSQAELRFDREGRISKVNFGVGDHVKKGAIIAELDTGEAALRRQQAESELSQAVDLFKAGAIAKPRLTQVQLAAELARKEFNRSFLKAPRDSSIGEINSQVGEYVTSQVTVASLVSIDTVFVEMGVIEKDLSKLHNRQTVNIEVESYPGTIFQGKITNIAPVVEGTSRTRLVKAEIPNQKGVLLPGMFAKCRIFIMEKPDTLVIPAGSVRMNGDKAETFLVNGKKIIKAVPIQLGHENADYAEITAGLKEDDVVVENVSENLRDGMSVEVVEELTYEQKG
jgi:membrane fusion protein (multidrug efflux system)